MCIDCKSAKGKFLWLIIKKKLRKFKIAFLSKSVMKKNVSMNPELCWIEKRDIHSYVYFLNLENVNNEQTVATCIVTCSHRSIYC